MTDIFVLIYILLLFGSIRKNKVESDVLSKGSTTALRGCAAITIVLHHLNNKVYNGGALSYFYYVGFIMCGLFFFLSGYGMKTSIKENKRCTTRILLRRISTVLIPYSIVYLIYLIYKVGVMNISFSQMIRNYSKGVLVVENSWYVVAQILMYVFFYVAFKSSQKDKVRIAVLLSLAIGYILFFKYALRWGTWWYNSCVCFVLGVIFSEYESAIVNRLKKKVWIIGAFVLGGTTYLLTVTKLAGNQTLIKVATDQLSCAFFCIILVLICMHYNVKNKVTIFLGEVSYEIYLLHGFYILLFKDILIVNNDILYVTLVFLCSIVSAVILNKIVKVPIRLMKKKLVN